MSPPPSPVPPPSLPRHTRMSPMHREEVYFSEPLHSTPRERVARSIAEGHQRHNSEQGLRLYHNSSVTDHPGSSGSEAEVGVWGGGRDGQGTHDCTQTQVEEGES